MTVNFWQGKSLELNELSSLDSRSLYFAPTKDATIAFNAFTANTLVSRGFWLESDFCRVPTSSTEQDPCVTLVLGDGMGDLGQRSRGDLG